MDRGQLNEVRVEDNQWLEYFPMPEEFHYWGTSNRDLLSFDDMWDLMVERGIPSAKGLWSTGTEHMCLLPKVDVVWGIIGPRQGRCIRDTTLDRTIKPNRIVYCQPGMG